MVDAVRGRSSPEPGARSPEPGARSPEHEVYFPLYANMTAAPPRVGLTLTCNGYSLP
jgi:hypothetical protein